MLRRWMKRTLDLAMKILRPAGRLLLYVVSCTEKPFLFLLEDDKPIIYKAGEGYPEVEILPRGGVYVSWEAVRRSPKAMANIRALRRAVKQCIREQEEVGEKVVYNFWGRLSFLYAREQMKEPAWRDSAAQTSDAGQLQDSGEGGR